MANHNPHLLLKENINALTLAFDLRKSDRKASPEEISVLKNYSGFGGISAILLPLNSPETWSRNDEIMFDDIQKLNQLIVDNSKDKLEQTNYIQSLKNSTLSAFYTPNELTSALAGSFKGNGIVFNRLLDPCSGTGQFLDSFSKFNNPELSFTAFEKDNLTGLILNAIYKDYPFESKVHISPFEKISQQYSNAFDVVSSNIPFGDFQVSDILFSRAAEPVKQYSCKSIHNYFFIKSLDFVRDGGIIAFITTESFLNSPSHQIFKSHLMKTCNLVSCVRLPSSTFLSTGTNVQTDFIILQKNNKKQFKTPLEEKFITLEPIADNVSIPSIFMDESRICHTHKNIAKNRFGQPYLSILHDQGIEMIAKDFSTILNKDLSLHFNHNLFPGRNSISSKSKSLPIQGNLFSQPVQGDLFTQLFAPPQSIVTPYMGNMEFSYHNKIVTQNGLAGLLDLKTEKPLFRPFEKQTPQILSLSDRFCSMNNIYSDLFMWEETMKTENPQLRESLNKVYDELVHLHGYLNQPENHTFLKLDAKALELFSLEIVDNEATQMAKIKSFSKADIFKAPVSFRVFEAEALSCSEALISSMDNYGFVDLNYISKTTSLNVPDILSQLQDRLLYNPLTDNWELKEYFLSGNIYEKLEGSLLKYEQIETTSLHYLDVEKSISLLKRSIPDKIAFELITMNLGQRWIPDIIYSDFASSLFQTKVYISYLKSSDSFFISCHDQARNFSINNTYCVHGPLRSYNGIKLMEHAFDNTTPIIKYTTKDENGKDIEIVDNEATQMAKIKIDKIRAEFYHFSNSLDADVKNSLSDKYNRLFNNYVKPQYDGSHLSLSELNLDNLGIPAVYDSQKNAAWMQICNHGGLIDHEVGGGKTLIMVIAAHEMKRLRVCNKPMIIGMKANIMDIVETYRKAYPKDRILFPGKNDFEVKNREVFLSSIQNNNWDCVILTHDQFKSIPQSEEVQVKITYQELENLERDLEAMQLNTSGDTKSNKQLLKGLEKRKANLISNLDVLNASIAQKKDNIVDFDKMGIDHIFVDESHIFKNLRFTTRHSRVAGLGNSLGSQRALNLLYAIRTIQEKKNRDLCTTFLSGTPISNSLTELYLIFKYLTPDKLEKQNTPNFDSWAANFAIKTTDFEFSVTNQIVPKERFRHFVNVPELSAFYGSFTDYKSAAMIGVDRPNLNSNLVSLEPNEEQKDFTLRLIEFARTGDGSLIDRPPLSNSEDQARMLIATNTAKKMALDMRLISPYYEDSPNNKINQCAAKVHEIYDQFTEERGTQIVFCDQSVSKKDTWNVYEEFKHKLVTDYGIPENEIQFIQDFSSENKRKDLFRDVNNGVVRILLGSTSTAGTGTNVQQRMVAMHHLDIPWRPSDLSQRNGRGARAGNLLAKKNNNTIDNYVYAVANSLDIYKFNLIQTKETFINQIKNSNLSVRTLDEGSMDESTGMPLAEYIAILSGDNSLLEKAKLEKEIVVLEGEKGAFYKEKYSFQNRIPAIDHDIARIESLLVELTKDADSVKNCPLIVEKMDSEGAAPISNISIKGLESNLVKDVGQYIIDLSKSNEVDHSINFGNIGNFDLSVRKDKVSGLNCFSLVGATSYRFNDGIINTNYPLTAVRHFEHSLHNITSMFERNGKRLNDLLTERTHLISIKEKMWDKEHILQEKKAELKVMTIKISAELNRKNESSIDNNQKQNDFYPGI